MLPPYLIDEEISKLDKCILSWNVIKVISQNNIWCFEMVDLYVAWNNWNIKVNLNKEVKECLYDWILYNYQKNEDIPIIWEKVNFLVWKKWDFETWYKYVLLSKDKVLDDSYKLISWTITEEKFKTCKPILKIEEYPKIYISLLLFCIVLFIILVIIVIKKLTKKP
jgi:hypothetical protein